jgi:thiosulfate dehydrogenase [quinone] large subunit
MNHSKSRVTALVLMRLAIGWHFLYEGGVKVLSGGWTSKAYLMDSGGFCKGFFTWIAGNEVALSVSDFTNAWGLTLIGLSLLIGLFTRFSSLAGMLLLLLYYLSHPAFPGIAYIFPSDGSYFIINKTLVEFFALLVLFTFPTSRQFGLARITRLNKTWTD